MAIDLSFGSQRNPVQQPKGNVYRGQSQNNPPARQLGSERSAWRATSGGYEGRPSIISGDTSPEESRLLAKRMEASEGERALQRHAERERQLFREADDAYNDLLTLSEDECRKAMAEMRPLRTISMLTASEPAMSGAPAPALKPAPFGQQKPDMAFGSRDFSGNQNAAPAPANPMEPSPHSPASGGKGGFGGVQRQEQAGNGFGSGWSQQGGQWFGPTGAEASQASPTESGGVVFHLGEIPEEPPS